MPSLERLPHLLPVLPPVQAPCLAAPAPHPPGLTRRLRQSSLSHQHLGTNYLSRWTVTFPGMKPVTRRRRRSWLLICDTLQLTAFLACTIFRPQTTPFFCVWKACGSCWALGTNQPLYWELQKLFSPKRTAIPVHLPQRERLNDVRGCLRMSSLLWSKACFLCWLFYIENKAHQRLEVAFTLKEIRHLQIYKAGLLLITQELLTLYFSCSQRALWLFL